MNTFIYNGLYLTLQEIMVKALVKLFRYVELTEPMCELSN